MYTYEELKKMKKEQLTKALMEAKKDITKHRLESRTAQTKNHHIIKAEKAYIARISTTLTELKTTNK